MAALGGSTCSSPLLWDHERASRQTHCEAHFKAARSAAHLGGGRDCCTVGWGRPVAGSISHNSRAPGSARL